MQEKPNRVLQNKVLNAHWNKNVTNFASRFSVPHQLQMRALKYQKIIFY